MKLNLKELQNFKQMLLQNEFFFKKKKELKLGFLYIKKNTASRTFKISRFFFFLITKPVS